MNNKQLDSYSMLICSKYLKTIQDFINLICVCKKFQETTEKLRFNPIPITSLKLFPKIQTQCFYDEDDFKLNRIDNYEFWYKMDYKQYLLYNADNVICHKVVYTYRNRIKFGERIPDGVNILGKWCFANKNIFMDYKCTIKQIIIPSTVTSISDYCFCECKLLTSIELPSTLTSLGKRSFDHCSSLKLITLPSTLQSLDEGCFFYCESLKSINLPSMLTSIGNHCFNKCLSLISINLPLSIISLSVSCFYDCESLTSINLSDALQSLDNECFSTCRSLACINLPSTLTSIGKYCFSNCKLLTSINLPSMMKSLEEGCFYCCSSLQSINLPTSLTLLGTGCLYGCSKLYNLNELPDICLAEPDYIDFLLIDFLKLKFI